jgi:hypothetical protein
MNNTIEQNRKFEHGAQRLAFEGSQKEKSHDL